ncbi:MAG: 50S ribosomal protein L18e [Candidatus Aenigmatarchaeota archaeon]|nr:MAG: 50S ribosomal protein L18e [Candidatus Aenigmarchaeota archaeon]
MTKRTGPTNPLVASLVKELRKQKKGIWVDVADRLEKPARQAAEVNVSAIARNAKDGEIALVPGKVLADGTLTKKIDVAALNFSMGAVMKISAAKGRCLSIKELMDENPSGKNVRIIT